MLYNLKERAFDHEAFLRKHFNGPRREVQGNVEAQCVTRQGLQRRSLHQCGASLWAVIIIIIQVFVMCLKLLNIVQGQSCISIVTTLVCIENELYKPNV